MPGAQLKGEVKALGLTSAFTLLSILFLGLLTGCERPKMISEECLILDDYKTINYLDHSTIHDSLWIGFDYQDKKIDVIDIKNRRVLSSFKPEVDTRENVTIRKLLFLKGITCISDKYIAQYNLDGTLTDSISWSQVINHCPDYSLPAYQINNFRTPFAAISKNQIIAPIIPVDINMNGPVFFQFGLIDLNDRALYPISISPDFYTRHGIKPQQIPIFDFKSDIITFVFRTNDEVFQFNLRNQELKSSILESKYIKLKNMDIEKSDQIQEINAKMHNPFNSGIVYDPDKKIIFIIESSPIQRDASISLFDRTFIISIYNKKFKKLGSFKLPADIIPIPYFANSKLYFQKKNRDSSLRFLMLSWK